MNTLIGSSMGEYRFVNFLGAGGMGEVYRAIHSKIGRVVAIKMLTHIKTNSGFTERFVNEARIQASLHHPNIAVLYDFSVYNGRPCIIMEYVDGQTLEERIKAHGILSLPEAIAIFQAIVEAIVYIHTQGIIHRDIKSNNIKISQSGIIKLLDFGIARDLTTPNLTLLGNCIGTPHYLSPEQIAGNKADTRSDIWSLGVLLYEMLTGKLPFEGGSVTAIYHNISKVSYPAASTINNAIPYGLETMLSRCLRKNPVERYSSARELLLDLQRISGNFSLPISHSKQRRFHHALKVRSAFPSFNQPPIGVILALFFILAGYLYFINDDSNDSTGKSDGPVITLDTSIVPIKISTYDGIADVYIGNKRVGQTPYQSTYAVGSNVELTLRREGYEDESVQFNVREIGNEYNYNLKKKDLDE